jgi:Fic family protein
MNQILTKEKAKYKGKYDNLFNIANVIQIGDTIYDIPKDFAVINKFMKQIMKNLHNNTLSCSIYSRDDPLVQNMCIFGDDAYNKESLTVS